MANKPTDDKLEKVRDLLFGSHAEQTERKTKQLEQRLTREVADLKKDLDKRLAALEEAVHAQDAALEEALHAQAAALHERIQQEKLDRETADKELGARVTDTGRAVGKRVTALQEQTAVNLRELKKALIDEVKALRLEAEEARAELGAEVDEELAALRDSSVGREDLARMLTEMAARLVKGADK